VFLVGLTGGIGSGKSTVAEHFGALGAGVVDTDRIAHELTVATSPVLAEIRAAFGAAVIGADGALDRAGMRALVFADASARARLESILHPRIREAMLERARRLVCPYVILVVPLLLETGQEELMDRVLVVDCPVSMQVARVQGRSGLSEAEIDRIIASQASREARLARADDVIDNSGNPGALRPRVEALHRLYLDLADGCAA